MTPTVIVDTDWTVIFFGDQGERSSMHVSMTKEKLDEFIKDLKIKVIDNLAYWNEIGDIHQFKPTNIFYIPGHIVKKEEIKNAKLS